MGFIDSGSKSSRLLASRRYTHNTFTTAQESFTNVLDLRGEEIYTQAQYVPSSDLPFSGSSQVGSILQASGSNLLKYWYRHKLTPSNVNREVWFFLNPTGSSDGIGAQLIDDNQQTNFISPKYSVSSLANATTEDDTPGYGVIVYKSSTYTQSNQTGSLGPSDIVSTNDYIFDYKTGVLQFLSSDHDPASNEVVFMTAYQYVGKTLATGLDLTGDITASNMLLSGNITLGDADTDSIQINAEYSGSMIPDVDNVFDLGSNSKQWKDLYVNGTAYIDTFDALTSTGDISGSSLEVGSYVSASGIRSNGQVNINSDFAQLRLSDDGFSDYISLGQSGAVGYIKTSDGDNNFKFRRGSDNTDLVEIFFEDERFHISGSGGLDVTGDVTASGNVSGSSISTGSFGRLEGNGQGLTNVSAVPFIQTSSYFSADSNIKITGSLEVSGNISGSYSGLSVGQKFKHVQSAASNTWTISHNFDYQYVNIDVYDDNDRIVIPATITATDSNTITITFGELVSGVAIISTGGQAIDEKGKNVTHTQADASSNWRVTHSIGDQYPVVTVYDGNDNVIIPETINAVDGSKMDIVFAQPQTGFAKISVGGGVPFGAITSSAQLSKDSFGNITGSVSSTGSFGALRVVGQSLNIDNQGTVSGSITSTGSFAHINSIELGSDISTLISGSFTDSSASFALASASYSTASSSLATRVDTLETSGSITESSASFSTRVSTLETSGSITESSASFSTRLTDLDLYFSGSGAIISGSSVSTGSFGNVNVAEMTVQSVSELSSSVASRLDTLSADVIALSIALG